MKKLFFFITVWWFATLSTGYAFDINKYCREVADAVGGSYQIEEACRKQEQKSKDNLDQISITSRIERYCREVAEAIGGSYQIMETCVKQEFAAKDRLK